MIDNNQFYNDLWENAPEDPYRKELLSHVLALLPNEPLHLLDVGCGDGFITSQLNPRGENYAIGLDRSIVGLKKYSGTKIAASAASLPIPQNSIDLIILSEVLEHLPQIAFENTLDEIKRAAKKWVIITVPNSESLWKRTIRCPYCRQEFHAFLHQRKFLTSDTKKLLEPQFKLVKETTCGNLEPRLPETIYWAACKATPNGAYQTSRVLLCPQCESRITPEDITTKSVFARGVRKLIQILENQLESIAPTYWRICLYERMP